MALRLCRDHGQPPAWWWGLEAGEQAILIADLRLRDRDEARAVEVAAQRMRGRRRG